MDAIKFKIKGFKDVPLLMDKYVDEKQPETDAAYKKQAEKKVYRDKEGYLAIEAVALKASIRDAASELAGRMKGKAMRQTINAQLFIGPTYLTIQPKRKKHDGIVKHMVSRKKGKDTVTRVPTYRPKVDEWTVEGKIEYVGLTIDFIKEVLKLAGMKYGMLSFRPQHGRFEIVELEEVK